MASFGRATLRTAGLAAAGTGVVIQGYRYHSTTPFFTVAYAESLPSDAKAGVKKMDWKGFTELKLESTEMVNHNVKRLTFALPDDQTVTDISPISE
jgi:hypothetical protein